MHPSLVILYYRMLGARIGKGVRIDKQARLGEYDLLTLHDGCRVDKSLVRGFCVEREGYFRLDHIVIGRRAVVNTYTQISPGTVIPDGDVYGPHASSHEKPSPRAFAAHNRTLILEPEWYLKAFVAWPIILLVVFVSRTFFAAGTSSLSDFSIHSSDIPWFTAIWLLVTQTRILTTGLNGLESVVYWFASPQRILYHALSRVVRAVIVPLLQLLLGIIVKRAFGVNNECLASDATQVSLLRRYINSRLLSQHKLKLAFSILGTHYEIVSVCTTFEVSAFPQPYQ